MHLVLRWATFAGALYITVWILKQLSLATDLSEHWLSWLVAVIIMGLVNTWIRPIARLLTAPLNCLTFGLIGVAVNAALFALVPYVANSLGVRVFELHWLGAVLGPLLMGVIAGVLGNLFLRPVSR